MNTLLTTTQPPGQRFTIDTTNAGPLDISLEPDTTATPGAQPPPIAGVDDGGVAIAGTGGSAGLLTYLKGVTVGQLLQWSGTAWGASFTAASQVANDAAGVPGAQVSDALISILATANAAGTVATTALANAATAQATATQAEQPFKGTYYVDPAFAGTQLGSASNPFTTIAAAFAAMLALGLTSGIVRIPPGVTVTENVVFPATGTDWEIASDVAYFGSTNGARITGTVTCTNTAAAVGCSYRLTNLIVNGAISGDIVSATGIAELFLDRCRCTSSLTLTASGGVAFKWAVKLFGAGVAEEAKWAGSSSGAVTIAGDLSASNWTFDSTVSYAPNLAQFNVAATFQNCWFNPTGAIITNTGIAGTFTRFVDCSFAQATTFTSTNATNLQIDGASMASLMSVGFTLAGGAVAVTTKNSNASSTTTIANNVASTPFGGRNLEGLYEVVFDATLLAQAVAGTLVVNAIYTDMTGTLVTAPVGSGLLVTAVVGTKAQGSLAFHHNGAAAPIAFSVTGVITATGLSVSLAVALRRVN